MGKRKRRSFTREFKAEAVKVGARCGRCAFSDRGSQYASADYQAVLTAHGIVCSMSRRGKCWDNAVAESFFSTLKIELAHDADWATHAAARADVREYLEIFYNIQRRHSALGYLSPVAFERQHAEHAAESNWALPTTPREGVCPGGVDAGRDSPGAASSGRAGLLSCVKALPAASRVAYRA